MSHKKKKRKPIEGLELNMTAMCDVVFQLLIYLILTAKPMDVITNLEANRPSPEAKPPPKEQIVNLLEIMVFAENYAVNKKSVSFDQLKSVLAKLATISKTQTVLIKCMGNSPHEKLIEVLDLCGQLGLKNLSVMSM